ncbi:hypothetical protein EJB05_12160, partial [Eragrostis curvula]
MEDAVAAQVEFGPKKQTLSEELLQVLIAGNATRLEELLISSDDGQANGHVAINVHAATPDAAAAAPGPGTHSSLLGVTSNGNTALHLVASRGHAKLATLICEKAPSLVATLNRSLDTPLHCAARGGHREVAACLLSTMRSRGVEEAAALRATNRLGDTALHEAVRHSREEVVDLFMAEAPELASVTSDDGVSPLYLAATMESAQMVRLLLRPSPDGIPSPASSAGRKGRTALHAAVFHSKEMVQDILAWEPEGPALLTRVDSEGRSALHFAVRGQNHDVVELLLNVDNQLAGISDHEGFYPVHYAAAWGDARMIDVLIKKCPEYYELVGNDGRNLLHCAVGKNNDTVVRYICQNERFAMLLNTTTFQGNTPLHLAVMYGYPRMVSILLQSRGVEVNIHNKDGLTARDVAYQLYPSGRLSYFLEPEVMVNDCLGWAGATESLDCRDLCEKDESDEEESTEKDYTKGTIASALIASVTFAAAFTVPRGFIADDDHPHPGTAILSKRFAFRAFVVSDTIAFLCSIAGTALLIYGGIFEIPDGLRSFFTLMSYRLVPTAAQFMIAAFALASPPNLGLVIFVYAVSSAAVLLVSSNTWIPLLVFGFAKAIWRRAGWKGLLGMDERPSGPLDLLERLTYNPLAMFSGGSLALPICVTFFIAIAKLLS